MRCRGSHTFSKQSASKWRWVCLPYSPAALTPFDDSWYLIILDAESSDLKDREYGLGDPLRWPRDILYQQKLALFARGLRPRSSVQFNSSQTLSLPQGHRAAVRTKRINKFFVLIGIRSHILTACRIVPQPTTLPRTPNTKQMLFRFWLFTLLLLNISVRNITD
jgi:hypothetical protein